MVEDAAKARVTGLVPMAHVADVQRSADFYKLLGMELRGSLKANSGELQWAHVACEGAELMFARRTSPLWPASRRCFLPLLALLASGIRVSPITYPNYLPKGEVRVEDPDGYTLLIGQAG